MPQNRAPATRLSQKKKMKLLEKVSRVYDPATHPENKNSSNKRNILLLYLLNFYTAQQRKGAREIEDSAYPPPAAPASDDVCPPESELLWT